VPGKKAFARQVEILVGAATSSKANPVRQGRLDPSGRSVSGSTAGGN